MLYNERRSAFFVLEQNLIIEHLMTQEEFRIWMPIGNDETFKKFRIWNEVANIYLELPLL